MTDPEVARLRRLRDRALRVREIARRLGSLQWAKNDTLLARGAGAGWRIARIVSGRLIAHPYLRYQKGAGVGTLIGNRLLAAHLGLVSKSRSQALKAYQTQLQLLSRQLDDARALTWSTEFSDTLGRSRAEIKSLIEAIASETRGEAPAERVATVRTDGPARADRLVGELASTFEGDWPYLAF